jgi:hypothetical protein
MSKKSNCTTGHLMFVHKIFAKSDIFCDLCKKNNFRCSYLASHQAFFFVFFLQHAKKSFSHKILYMDIVYMDVA